MPRRLHIKHPKNRNGKYPRAQFTLLWHTSKAQSSELRNISTHIALTAGNFQALSEVLIDPIAGFAYNWLVRPLKHAHSKPDHAKAVIVAALRRFGPLSRAL